MSKEYIEDRIEQLERDNESLREQVNDLIAEVNDLYERDSVTTDKLLRAVKELQAKVAKPHQLAYPIE
tara:strand:+ start:412 stop:615 length:204 start_codon:yes stop_codon:yes gene_type:complete